MSITLWARRILENWERLSNGSKATSRVQPFAFLLHHMMTLLAIQFRFHFFLPRQWLISFSGSYFHSAVKTDSLLWQLSWRAKISYWGGGKKEEKRGRTRRRNARPGYFDTLHKSHPSSRFVDRNCGIIHKEKNPPPFPQPLLPSRAPFFRTRIAPNVSRQLFHCCLCCHFSFREMGLG